MSANLLNRVKSSAVSFEQYSLLESDGSKSAIISDDGRYRYYLSRRWASEGKVIAFICLNPSTADASLDDPTVKKCIRMAKSWGGAALVIGNLFAYRSTDPLNLKKCADPIGSENDIWLKKIIAESDLVVAAWGTNGDLLDRNQKVLNAFGGQLYALRLTKDGHPSHPLYLPETLFPFKL
ncbi:DUF1643 domain-containing protein [Massilia oculi]|uniref:DUF1643 domain-containing protein n=1 Tax=Massilia oculi TaxID=945844 RepID=UPI0028A85893|nr:DUF1643 domain-containing protein [Massilia oculi]